MKIAYIIFSYLALFILGIIDNSRGPVYPVLLNIFSITKAQGSLIFSITSFASFGLALLSKFWLVRFGALKSTKFSLICHLVACILMGTVSSGTLGFYQFLFASLLVGIGIGINSITVNLIINNSTPINKRRQIFAGLHSMYGMAALLAPTILAWVFNQNLNWKYFFLVLAFIPGFILLGSLKLKDNNPSNTYLEKLEMSKKQLLIISVIFGFYVCAEMIISTRLVVYLNEVKSFGLDESSTYLSLFFLFLLGGRLLFAVKHFNIKSKTLLKVSIVASIISTVVGIYFEPFFLCLTGLTMSFYFPCAMDWLGEELGTQMDIVVSKVFIFVGGALVAMHMAFGNLANIVGLGVAIWVCPILLVIVLYLLQFRTGFLAKSS